MNKKLLGMTTATLLMIISHNYVNIVKSRLIVLLGTRIQLAQTGYWNDVQIG